MSGSIEPVVAGTAPTPAGSGRERAEELRRAARAFEGLLWQQLLHVMRRAQLQEGFFGQGPGRTIYEGLFEQFLSERLAEGGSLGLAEALLEQWGEAGDPRVSLERLQAESWRQRALEGFAQVAGAADDTLSGGFGSPERPEPLQGGRDED